MIYQTKNASDRGDFLMALRKDVCRKNGAGAEIECL
jgi:hypothetical protein